MKHIRRKLGIQTRTMEYTGFRKGDEEDDPAKRVYSFAASSETPVERHFGMEILSHSRAAVDLSAMRNGAPLLLNHNPEMQIGVVREAEIGEDNRLSVAVQFSRSAFAQEIRQDLEDGIRTQVSIGYRVLRARRVKAGDADAGTRDEILVTRWRPHEASIVPIAADQTVGVGRAGGEELPVEFEEEGGSMKKKVWDSERGAVIEVDDSDPRVALTDEQFRALQGSATRSAGGGSTPAPENSPNVAVITETANQRAQAITNLCVRHNRLDRLPDLLKSGKTPNDIAAEFLDDLSKEWENRGPAGGAREARVENMNAKERKGYSLRKAILNALAVREGTKPEFGLEMEVHREISKQVPEGYTPHGGFFTMLDTRSDEERYEAEMKRAWPLDSATSTEGAEFKFVEPGQFIELLRTRMYVALMGATILNGLRGPVTFPRQTAATSGTWLAEEATLGANVMPAFNTVALAPKTLMLNTGFTRQLLVQAAFAVEQIVRNDIAAVYGRAIDLASLHGAGGSEPTGIYAASGVNAVAFGGTVTYAKIIEMVNAVAVANADFGALGWLATPGVASKSLQLLEIAGVAPKIWTGGYNGGTVAGYPALATNQLKANMGAGTNEHGLIFGNWNELMIGNWNALEILVDPITSKLKGIIELTAFAMVDVALKHGASMSKATGLIP